MQYRKMPKLDDELSILGLGCMRLPMTEEKKIDEEQAFAMMKQSIDSGINYFDTAWPYHQGESELVVGKFLAQGYRDKVLLATKLPSWLINTREDMDEYLNKQLERLQTDHIDYYLVHALNNNLWKNLLKHGIFDFLEKAKADGKIVNIGFSFHDKYPVFSKIINAYDWDFCQIQLNFFDTTYQAGLRGMRLAASKGIGVIVMEPLRGGKLVSNIPPEIEDLWNKSSYKSSPAERALRWVWNQPEVQIILSGMSNMEQLQENIKSADVCQEGQLSPKELRLYQKARKTYLERMAVGCTSCAYCMPCPHGVNIPMCLGLYNNGYMFGDKTQAKREYLGFVREESRADKCVNCGICLEKCPQQINIPKQLRDVVKYFE